MHPPLVHDVLLLNTRWLLASSQNVLFVRPLVVCTSYCNKRHYTATQLIVTSSICVLVKRVHIETRRVQMTWSVFAPGSYRSWMCWPEFVSRQPATMVEMLRFMFVPGLLLCHLIKFWSFFRQESKHLDLKIYSSNAYLETCWPDEEAPEMSSIHHHPEERTHLEAFWSFTAGSDVSAAFCIFDIIHFGRYVLVWDIR